MNRFLLLFLLSILALPALAASGRYVTEADISKQRLPGFVMGLGAGVAVPVGKASVGTTGIGNVGGGEDNLITYSLPANSFRGAGKGVRITAWGTTANNSNPKTVNLYFGSQVILTTALTVSQVGTWRAQAVVFATGIDTQDWSSSLLQGGTATIIDVEGGTATQDDGAAVTIKATGTVTDGGGGINNNDIVQEGLLVEFL
jgi:hypothetical protein